MRLLNISTYQLEDFDDSRCAPEDDDEVPFAILSHRWVMPEVLLQDIPAFRNRSQDPFWEKAESAKKIVGACDAVRQWNAQHRGEHVGHIWIDTCCINRANLAELSKSLNSMFRWYARARVCLAYLFDHDAASRMPFTASQWFQRGWTLQELVAPARLDFFDGGWARLGSKASLEAPLAAHTRIDGAILRGSLRVTHPSVAQRLSWYGERRTAVPEDAAYCLLGLFDVHLPPLYGEGAASAFLRVQEEVIRYDDDHSIFAWKMPEAPDTARAGLLAPAPSCFQGTGRYQHRPEGRHSKPFFMTNKGLSIELPLQRAPPKLQGPRNNVYIASLDCLVDDDNYLGVYLECLSAATQQYCRVRLNAFCSVAGRGRGEWKSIFVKRFAKVTLPSAAS